MGHLARVRNLDNPLFPLTASEACLISSRTTPALEAVPLGQVDDDNNLDAVFANSGAVNRFCLGGCGGGFSCGNVSSDAFASTDVALGERTQRRDRWASGMRTPWRSLCLQKGGRTRVRKWRSEHPVARPSPMSVPDASAELTTYLICAIQRMPRLSLYNADPQASLQVCGSPLVRVASNWVG